MTEIWLPDVQPYNSFTGIHNSLDPSVSTSSLTLTSTLALI